MAKASFRVIFLVALSCCTYINCITVCDDYKHYITPTSKHCRNNPDGERNITEIMRSWAGVTAEEYNLYTDDGYQILIIRAYSSKEKHPIVLGHSVFVSAWGWVNRGEKSLANYLIKQGHEVWLINFRGTAYSRGHKKLTTSDDSYWNFSFYEMGIYDLHSTLQLVKKTCNKKAIYIGYATGTTAGYVYGSRKPDDAESYLLGMISLAPLAYLTGIKSYFRFILPAVEYLRPVIYQRTHGRISLDYGLSNCTSVLDMYLHEVAKVPLYGDDFAQIDPSYLPLIQTENTPDAFGIDVMIHYAQIMRTKSFQGRDFGKDTNIKVYNQEKPAKYPLNEIPVPLALFIGDNDWVSTKENARLLYSELSPSSQCGFNIVDYDKWSHKDFIEAKDVMELLYKPLLNVLSNMCNGKCLNKM